MRIQLKILSIKGLKQTLLGRNTFAQEKWVSLEASEEGSTKQNKKYFSFFVLAITNKCRKNSTWMIGLPGQSQWHQNLKMCSTMDAHVCNGIDQWMPQQADDFTWQTGQQHWPVCLEDNTLHAKRTKSSLWFEFWMTIVEFGMPLCCKNVNDLNPPLLVSTCSSKVGIHHLVLKCFWMQSLNKLNHQLKRLGKFKPSLCQICFLTQSDWSVS